ncbi:hypothetical protein RvY_02943 [Ramazzottius varieornatus]|uniref:Alpha-1,4-N-acetylglucosaminyltransferase n=1 Tax=Ramazzottius varieornatus TaxID=947166 RepID=A0A1D1UPU3_RAMVA|nr:hypothetical protein RvY_02943 [Ramazzottius varieornatus]
MYTDSIGPIGQDNRDPFGNKVGLAFQTIKCAGKYDVPGARNPAEWMDKPIVKAVWREIDALAIANPTVADQLSFLECLSLRSVVKNLKPDQIIIHTNVVDFWPLDSCNELVTNWTGIHLKYLPRRFTMKGQRIKWISHEVDIAKLSVLRHYGGLTLDFDVFIINGTEVRRLLNSAPCIICDENPKDRDGFKVNAGFFGCFHKELAQYPALIREQSYDADYKASKWVYNIGLKAMKILRKYPKTAVLVENICNNPAWDNISLASGRSGACTTWIYRCAWLNLVGLHLGVHCASLVNYPLRQDYTLGLNHRIAQIRKHQIAQQINKPWHDDKNVAKRENKERKKNEIGGHEAIANPSAGPFL